MVFQAVSTFFCSMMPSWEPPVRQDVPVQQPRVAQPQNAPPPGH